MRTLRRVVGYLLAITLVFGLTFGALLISWIVGEWIIDHTGNHSLGIAVGASLATAFCVNLAIQIGTFNYLHTFGGKVKPQLSEETKAWLHQRNAR